MLINNTDISLYKAKLLERVIGVAEVDNSNVWSNRSSLPSVQAKYYYSYKKISLKFDIVTSSGTELENCKSELTKALEKATINFSDIEINYTGYYVGTPTIEHAAKYNDTVAFTFYAYAWKEEKTEIFNNTLTKIINVTGNLNTPCIIEITSTMSYGSIVFNINGRKITISNIIANKKIILDGYTGKFTQDGNNKFTDIDLWEMPYLDPGSNLLTVDKNVCNITVMYKNLFA